MQAERAATVLAAAEFVELDKDREVISLHRRVGEVLLSTPVQNRGRNNRQNHQFRFAMTFYLVTITITIIVIIIMMMMMK